MSFLRACLSQLGIAYRPIVGAKYYREVSGPWSETAIVLQKAGKYVEYEVTTDTGSTYKSWVLGYIFASMFVKF